MRVSVTALAVAVLVGVFLTGSAAGQAVDVSDCRTIGTPGTYELNQSITDSTVGTCLEITADNVVLDGNGFTVDGVNQTMGSKGVEVRSSLNVTVKDVEATGWDTGIQNIGNAFQGDGKIIDNNASRNDIGISVASPDNDVIDNKAKDNRRGISVRGAQNTLRSNNVSSNQNGITAATDNNTLIQNNATENDNNGISLFDADDNRLIRNNASQNSAEGISLELGSKSNNLTENRANENGFTGIVLEGESDRNDLIGNIARDNTGGEGDSAGILLQADSPGPSNNTLLDNEATGDQTYGIWLSGASDNVLRENKANRNNQVGIYLSFDSNDNDLIDNDANFNGEGIEEIPGEGIHGIWVNDGSNFNNLTGNQAFDNGPRDIRARDIRDGVESESEDGSVETSQIDGSPSSGIFLGGENDGVSNNTLIDNEARDTGVGGEQTVGILLFQANDNELRENTASENLQIGILLLGDPFAESVSGSGNNELSENVAEENQIGIETFLSFSNTFEDDTSRNNAVLDYLDISTFDSLLTSELEPAQVPEEVNTIENLNIGSSEKPNTEVSFEIVNFGLRGTAQEPPENPEAEPTGRYFEAVRVDTSTTESVEPQQEDLPSALLDIDLHYEEGDLNGIDESSLRLWGLDAFEQGWTELVGIQTGPGTVVEDSQVDESENVVSWKIVIDDFLEQEGLSTQEVSPSQVANPDTFTFGAFGEGGKTCIDRRSLSRGQGDLECPFDRGISRGDSREGFDRSTGRGGDGTHTDSATSRRNRGRSR